MNSRLFFYALSVIVIASPPLFPIAFSIDTPKLVPFITAIPSKTLINEHFFIQSVQTVEIIGKPLTFPNPGNLDDTITLGYRLNSEPQTDVAISFYDMRGVKIKTIQLLRGLDGARSGYNRVLLNHAAFDYYILPTGPYFYIIHADGKVIGKNKMMVYNKSR